MADDSVITADWHAFPPGTTYRGRELLAWKVIPDDGEFAHRLVAVGTDGGFFVVHSTDPDVIVFPS